MGKEEEIREAIEKLGLAHAEEVVEVYAKMANNFFEKNMVPQDVLGIKNATVENIYRQAYQLYNSGKYKEALKLFRVLVMLNVTDPRYAFGIASCYHMLKDYKNAVKAYCNYTMFDSKCPLPYYHSADCLIQMDKLVSAMATLQMAIKRAEDKPEYAIIKEKAKLTLQSLKEKLKQQSKEKAKK